jgi:ketosteroid isomerase-like protein
MNVIEEKRIMQNRINKHRNRIIAILAIAAITMFVTALPANAQDDVKSVSDVLTKSAAGFEKGDMAVLEKLWANDESVTVFESGHANYGWVDYRDHHLGPEMKEMKNTKYTLSDIKVKVSGNTAWATFKYAISADIGTRHVDGAGLGTAVLEKRGQDWRIVHWHSSAPRRAPSPAAGPTPRP